MGLRRRLLRILALVSLATLVYAGVSLAFSVPVMHTAVEANESPLGGVPPASRAVVVPVSDPALVATLHDGTETFLGYHGAFLAYGTPGRIFPAGADDVRLGRALLFLPADARPETAADADATGDGTGSTNASDDGADASAPAENSTTDGPALNESSRPRWLVNLTGVPMPHADTSDGTNNLTLDLDALHDGRAGFVVKGDHVAKPTFVPLDDVVGEVARFDPASRIAMLLTGGATGFLAPLALLAVMRRNRREGGRGEGDACDECRAPLEPKHSFCLRCGAWKEEIVA